ncbi:amino acid adenylation domain-containing protein [Streptomyces sp. NPDC006798]|uniref:amino acid adenylation domain-containing protein n=1 Tax=Streptomyces sp. NPDC006798 TaxID=3155462 RepID=UPI003408338A
MSVPSAAADGMPPADPPSGRPLAQVCHSLVRRLPTGTGAASVRAALDALMERHPGFRGVRLFDERLGVGAGDPVARIRRDREAGRTVDGDPVVARAVVLGYADGEADLVLVAHRRVAADRRALGRLASALSEPGSPLTPPEAAAPGPEPAPASTPARGDASRTPARTTGGAPPLPWGLGDPDRAGRIRTVELAAAKVAADTAPALLVAATALVLARYGASEQAVFGLLAEGPGGGETESLVILPVRDGAGVTELLEAAAERTAPGGERPPEAPAVRVLLTEERPGESYRPAVAPAFPATLDWRYDPDGTVSGVLHHDEGAVAPAVARQFAGHLDRAVRELADAPATAALGDIALVTADEAAAVRAAGRTPARDGTAPVPLHETFRAVAAAQPDAPALSGPGGTLDYAELDARSDTAARVLRSRGVLAGDRVGVCLDRDTDLVVTLLGILKSGAAYVPMDGAYPADRLVHTVTDAGLRLVVSSAPDFPAVAGVTVLSPAELSHADDGPDPARTDTGTDADAIAYVIYTSGSTGRPKGVAVPHRNVHALLSATADDFGFTPADTWTLFHSSAFDFSVWEIWGALLTGGHLVVVPYYVSRSPEDFHGLLVRYRVTVLSQTPSAFAALNEADRHSPAALSVRLVVFGGEPLDVRILRDWFRGHPHTRCRVVNMYGITETTVHVTAHTVTPPDLATGSRTVGRALPGWSVSVRDPAGRVQPFGAPGEIWVGGAGVADRYLGRDELTAARFVTDPATGERVYRSGDLGRLRPDGRLDHLGRIDDQVKVRGFRIELGEIRSVLLEDDGVTAAAVVLGGDPDDPAGVRLDAYVVPRDAGVSMADVRRRAARRLPEYMVPATLTPLSELPLTVNGKFDVDGLAPEAVPDPGPTPATGSGEPADDPVLRVWREILGDHIGPHDDFFTTGGNSLLAVRLSGALRRAGLPPVSLRELHIHPTPAEVSALIAGRDPAGELPGPASA